MEIQFPFYISSSFYDMNYYADSKSDQFIKLSNFNWKNHLKLGLKIKKGYTNRDFPEQYSDSLERIGECVYDTIKCKYLSKYFIIYREFLIKI